MPDYREEEARQVSNPPSRTAPAQKRSPENRRGMLIVLVLIFIGASIQSLANYGAGSGSTVGGIGAMVALTSVYPLRFLRWWLVLLAPLIWGITAVLSVVLPFGLWLKQAGMI